MRPFFIFYTANSFSWENFFVCVLFTHFPLNDCSFLQHLEFPGTGLPLCLTQQVYPSNCDCGYKPVFSHCFCSSHSMQYQTLAFYTVFPNIATKCHKPVLLP